MSQISDIENPWRRLLINTPASFRGVVFHVESGGRSSGRRAVDHQYPKRNKNYGEDMGLQSRHFTFTGYLVYRPRADNETNGLRYDYVRRRIELYEALEADDIGRLVHPVFAPNGVDALCERYSMTETRERGGYTQFEMSFVEHGAAVSSLGVAVDTSGVIKSAAKTAIQSIISVRG